MFDSLKVLEMFDSHISTPLWEQQYTADDTNQVVTHLLAVMIINIPN